jgi:hypothetical protein
MRCHGQVHEEGHQEVTTTKIAEFRGTLPRVAPELLPGTAAQTAQGVKLYSGDLIPTPTPVVAAAAGRTGTIRTLYALRDPVTSERKWLTWANEVDIATPAADELGEQRFYYTGDGAPKVSTYAMATSGAAPYPSAGGYYNLGLPLPTAQPVATPTTFSSLTSASFARDGGGNVTLTTSTAHNLKDGALATISGFSYRTGTYTRALNTITVTINNHGLVTGTRIYIEFTSGGATTNSYTVTVTGTNTFTVTDTVSGTIASSNCRWDIRDLNITTTVTVINPTTITYFSPGAQVATTTSSEGKVDLGGLVQARTYLYTWYTPWDEESIGSEPSTAIFIKEGQIVTISGLPTARPAGDNFIRGIRLYRTLATTADAAEADYFRLATLWFPQGIASVSRTSGVVTLKFSEQHKFIKDDRFKLSGCSVAGFDITGGVVTTTPDQFTITYAQAGSDTATTAATGTVYYDVAENPPTDAARYWGDGSYDFTDDFNYRSLTTVLDSNEFDAPPADLQGLTVIQNNLMVGFTGNDVYFTEPNKFHAWPEKYKISLEYNIVGLVALGSDLLVMTEGYPYVISGSDPAVLSTSRYSTNYPCLSKRSIVQTDVGVMYSTHEGLALASFTGGVQIVTAPAHSPDTWNAALDPSTITAVFYDSLYFGSHSTGSFFYRRSQDGQNPGDFITYNITFTATWFDPLTGALYYVTGTDGDIVLWDDPAQPNSDYTWKSKVFVSQEPFNMGAARVVADYTGVTVSPVWSEWDSTWITADVTWDVVEPVTFKLYANRSLVLTTTRADSDVFRLPAGYKTDTYEVEISGTVRVRAVHLGETPTSLKGS